MYLKKWNKQFKKPMSLLLLGLLILAGAAVRPAYAAGLTVDSLADTIADDGTCTLREAITNANNDDQSGSVDCAAGSNADTITFSVDGTITLGSALPDISSEMTIDGTGHSVTVSGDNAYRVMAVNASGTLNLNALTIANGYAPQDDHTGDGGGIYNNGTLTVTNSTFTGNSAYGNGGAIANDKTATISNSTFSGNNDYAIFHSGYNSINTILVSNSTIAGNSGGLVYTYGGATLQNTIIANNGTDCYAPISGGGLTAASSNMDSDGTCDNATTQTAVQLNLGTLADNGGETQTIALLSGSTAVDAGDNATCPATDQRGVVRPQANGCDVGAFELEVDLQTGPTFTVNTLGDDHGLCIVDDCTLRGAINAANAVAGADTILFSVDGTITLGSALPDISSEMTIDGAGHSVTVSGDNAYRVMAVNTSGTLNLNALTITGGFIDGINAQGGAVFNQGTLNVSNSTFTGNSVLAGAAGGAIQNRDGILTISNSTFSANSAGNGAIYNYSGLVTISNSTIVGNDGGGLSYLYGTYTLYNSIVAENPSKDNCIRLLTGEGGVTADSSNMDSDGTCDNATTQTAVQLNLGTLADNGGETQTIALLSGSTAVDAGDNATCPATDQRGVVRPQASGCDIGAFELEFTNHLPVVLNDSYNTDEETQLDVAAPGVLGNDSDEDGDVLTAVLVDDASNGDLTLNSDGSFTYIPDVGFSGDDTFTYVANDGTGDSTLATVTITVELNFPPVAVADAYSTLEGTQLDVMAPGVLANDSDAEGDVLTAVLLSDASNGDLTLNPDGSFTYIPDTGFSGDDTFTYVAKADAGLIYSDETTVTITVEMLPSGPTCQGVPATIVGTDGNDILIGTAGDDVIVGLKGDDIIRGKGGNDLICGGMGDDWLIGGSGDDRLYGGPGWDTLLGNTGNDELYGGMGDDWLYGGLGDDLLFGQKGFDVLYGGPGADEMHGGPGQDWLIGDDGNDALDGGLGDADSCWGGADTDTAVNCEAVYGVP